MGKLNFSGKIVGCICSLAATVEQLFMLFNTRSPFDFYVHLVHVQHVDAYVFLHASVC